MKHPTLSINLLHTQCPTPAELRDPSLGLQNSTPHGATLPFWPLLLNLLGSSSFLLPLKIGVPEDHSLTLVFFVPCSFPELISSALKLWLCLDGSQVYIPKDKYHIISLQVEFKKQTDEHGEGEKKANQKTDS